MKELIKIIPALFAVIVALINIIVNCIKKSKTVENPKKLVVIVAIVLCLIAAGAIGIYFGFSSWYAWAAAAVAGIIAGFVAAYVAMYGYDAGYNDFIYFLKNLIDYLFCGGIIDE